MLLFLRSELPQGPWPLEPKRERGECLEKTRQRRVRSTANCPIHPGLPTSHPGRMPRHTDRDPPSFASIASLDAGLLVGKARSWFQELDAVPAFGPWSFPSPGFPEVVHEDPETQSLAHPVDGQPAPGAAVGHLTFDRSCWRVALGARTRFPDAARIPKTPWPHGHKKWVHRKRCAPRNSHRREASNDVP